MIRINCFFEVREDADTVEAVNLGVALVEKSRNDKGCVAYDLFQSTGRPRVMMFCETWVSQADLDAHAASEHFNTIVPRIEALSLGGLKLERFEF